MKKYTVLETSFIGHSLREAGDIVELPDDAEVGPNLQPVEEGPAKSKKSAEASA